MSVSSESHTARTSVTQRAIEQVTHMISVGELRPGERLPTEREFAAFLGLSRSSMREAIRALTIMGVLEIRHGSGAYVTGLRPSDLLDNLGVVADVSRGETLVELLQVRRVLEAHATAVAAARITDEQLVQVRGHLDRIAQGRTIEEMVGADRDFHRAIVEASGNATLAAVLDGLSSRTFRARVWRGHEDEDAVERLHKEHERIHGALSRRDPQEAYTAAASHVMEVESWLRARSGAKTS